MTSHESLEAKLPASQLTSWRQFHAAVESKVQEMKKSEDQVADLTDAIRTHYLDTIERLKEILVAKSIHYDALVARLQYLEEMHRSPINRDSTGKISPELFSQLVDEIESQEPMIFAFDDTTPAIHLEIDGFFAVTYYVPEPVVECDTFELDREINELRTKRAKYLSTGLQWKRKFESSQSLLNQMLSDNASEIESLSTLLPLANN
jgi:hypothetical protein